MKLLLVLTFISITFSFLAQDLALAKLDDKYGFINREGEFVIKDDYIKAADFSDDLAGVLINDKWGFINRKGEVVIEPQFEKIKSFNSGIAVVLKNENWHYINKKGEIQTNFPPTDKLYDFSEGRAIIKVADAVGMIDNQGNLVVKTIYKDIKRFSNGSSKVRKNEKWGYIDGSGNVIVDLEYDKIGSLVNNTTWGLKGEQHGVIKDNNFKVLSEVSKIWDFNNEGIAYAKSGDKIGFINSDGEWVIAPKFDKAKSFSNGMAPVCIGKEWGYIDLKGEWIIEPSYRDAETFSEDGFAPVKIKQWGFINTKGELVIPAEYGITAGFGFSGNSKGFNNGLARVKSKKGWTFLTTEGKPIGGKWFRNLELFN